MRYLLGPEVLWLVIYGLAHLVAKMNKVPDHPLDKFIEHCWVWVPVLVLFTFGLYWSPVTEKNLLMLRIWIVGIIMGHLVLETLMKAYSEQGPGIGMAYLAGILLTIIVLFIGSIMVKIIH